MASGAFGQNPTWRWPADSQGSAWSRDGSERTSGYNAEQSSSTEPAGDQRHRAEPPGHYPPRTCRICLETVLPTYEPPSASIPGLLNPSPSVNYISSDPTAGRLIRPCNCRGSSRYVHEGCLQAWRHSDPAYGRRNYWQCPTCGFRYRLERMRWANWISSKATQLALTITILFLAMFLLGFVADPIINFYLDPYGTISSVPLSKDGAKTAVPLDDEPSSWIEHFVKGLASLGLLSFVKVLFAMSPWQWWNLRSSGLMGGSGRAGGGTGRDRLASISWIVVVIGVGTFLWGVYKGVRAWSRRTLEKAGEKVMDVHGGDDEQDEDEIVDSAEGPSAYGKDQ